MQEGEPILGGGPKLNPNNTQPTNNPGIQQPVVSATTFAPSNTTGGGATA